MIAALRGTLIHKSGDVITVLTPAGVGYEISVPIGVLSHLPDVGRDVQLHTVLVVRDDDWSLYGFDSRLDRTVFERLLAASGVGPRLALAMVSALGGDRVVRALRDDDLAALCTVQGVGKKKAERMILELKDRIGDLAATEQPTATPPVAEEAVTALVSLGYSRVEADEAVRASVATNGASDTSRIIREALSRLTNR